jgi:hypothetical protein
MRKKAYGFKVAGQTKQGSARLALLGSQYVSTKRSVNRDVDYLRSKSDKAEMVKALNGFTPAEQSALATKAEYKAPRSNGVMKASAMPMNFYRGTGFGS